MFSKVKTLSRAKSVRRKGEPDDKPPGSGTVLLVGELAQVAEVRDACGTVSAAKVEACKVDELAGKLAAATYDVVVFDAARDGELSTIVRGSSKNAKEKMFVIMYGSECAGSAKKRLQAYEDGVNMVTASPQAVAEVMASVIGRSRAGPFTCPHCEAEGFFEDDLVDHMLLFHFNASSEDEVACPICLKGKFQKGSAHRSKNNVFVHVKNEHGKVSRGEEPAESRAPTPVWPFALVVVKNAAGQFLLVQEYASSGYWLPAGKVNPGEDIQDAAQRITKEQTGMSIEITGILRASYTPQDQIARMRVVYLAKPTDESQPLKTIPDYNSLGAVWAATADLPDLKLRGSEPRDWFPYVTKGGTVYPLDVMKSESAPV
ncbi:8-oxo-dGDP phosphatase NUDT18 [Porphyridium purpureum]|uniref:8-oxo-dGDP phosphatase NUDT18 n=1 Tax=Porphyridium purpureum TaxID=35688 RepID=A0A5J4Z5M9_PORPP|nr:8-oxo-dGDP phosphatase NUDT18 [Porphyridium purpureum]|eukprot:POR6400..scf295_1